MKILFQQVTLVVINQRGGAAYHCALNRLTDKTAVPHLRKGNFIYIAAALRADLNQTVLCKFNECFAHRLTRDIKTDGYLFLRERRSWRDQAVNDITSQNAIDLLINRLGRIELRFSGHVLWFLRELTCTYYHSFVCHHIPGPQAGKGKLTTMDAKSGKTLADRHHFNGVDINVFW